MAKNIKNPFIYQGYEGPEYFCDRIAETEKLSSSLYNGRNVTLISPRRIGKTGLIKNTFHHINVTQKDALCLYIDIFATKNQHDFVSLFGTAIIDEMMSKGKSPKKRAMDFFSSWRPVFSIDPLTGSPTVSISIEPKETEMTLKNIFAYLKSLEKDVFIAIDEFQQIAEYPEKGMEALLRSHIQFAQNVHFVFSGSKAHLMSEMFVSPKRPLFQSTALMNLHPIHEEIYYDFAQQFFAKKKGELNREVFGELYRRFEGYTWYMQAILNRLYEEHKSVRTIEQLNEAIRSMLTEKAPQYESLAQFLTPNQLSLLQAIAQESKVKQPTSKDFIKSHNLSGASSIQLSLEQLVNKELVYRQPDGYVVYDRFLEMWLRRYLP